MRAAKCFSLHRGLKSRYVTTPCTFTTLTFQTCDLANLGRNGVMMDLAAKMPNLIALRNSLYSDEFKEMIKEITGILRQTHALMLHADAQNTPAIDQPML